MYWHQRSLPTWPQYKNLLCDVLQGGPWRQTVSATLIKPHEEGELFRGEGGSCAIQERQVGSLIWSYSSLYASYAPSNADLQSLKGAMFLIISGPIIACFPWLELSPNNPSLTPKHSSTLTLSGHSFSYLVLNTIYTWHMLCAICYILHTICYTQYTYTKIYTVDTAYGTFPSYYGIYHYCLVYITISDYQVKYLSQ